MSSYHLTTPYLSTISSHVPLSPLSSHSPLSLLPLTLTVTLTLSTQSHSHSDSASDTDTGSHSLSASDTNSHSHPDLRSSNHTSVDNAILANTWNYPMKSKSTEKLTKRQLFCMCPGNFSPTPKPPLSIWEPPRCFVVYFQQLSPRTITQTDPSDQSTANVFCMTECLRNIK